MERRTALKLIAAGVIAERVEAQRHHLVTIAQTPEAYKLQFFTPAENELLDRLTDLIIPTDDHSPGAHGAQVSLFIDLMAANSKKDAQEKWRSGLAAVDAEAQRRFQQRFLKCSAGQQDRILAAMAASEAKPSTEIERFFVRLKSMTVDGYYTSSIGIQQELEYRGNTALAEFPGCTHPEH
jgi:glucoside 3-dehydrogenase (cytochrome c) hitch-hiker subunit